MQSMTIGQLARRAGVHVETIRHYQQIRLLEVPSRPAGSVRRYEQDALDRLGFIRRAQDAGFILKQITEKGTPSPESLIPREGACLPAVRQRTD